MNLASLRLHLQTLLCLSCLATWGAAGEWRSWRGPLGTNVAEPGQNLPPLMNEETGVLWKTKIPGRGHSSPIILGDQIFLTSADKESETQFVLGFDRRTGEQQWKTIVNQGGFPKIHSNNSHASQTVATDGEALFVMFENHLRIQLVKLDLQGQILFDISAFPYSPTRYQFGTGASPALYQHLVFVIGETDEGFLSAFTKGTGELVWQVPRNNTSYSSPIVANIAGKDQLLICGNDEVQALDPLTGKLLWSVPGTTAATAGTVTWSGNKVFASGGFPGAHTLGIDASDITDPQLLWSHNERLYEQSVLAFEDRVYAINDTGIGFCWQVSDGKEVWKTRLSSKNSASPVLADGIIYHIDERGRFTAFRHGTKRYERVFQEKLGDEAFATPSICGGRMYCRVAKYGEDDERTEYMYCFGTE